MPRSSNSPGIMRISLRSDSSRSVWFPSGWTVRARAAASVPGLQHRPAAHLRSQDDLLRRLPRGSERPRLHRGPGSPRYGSILYRNRLRSYRDTTFGTPCESTAASSRIGRAFKHSPSWWSSSSIPSPISSTSIHHAWTSFLRSAASLGIVPYHAIRQVAKKMSLNELKARIEAGSMRGLPASSKEFLLVQNECAINPLPDYFVEMCIRCD